MHESPDGSVSYDSSIFREYIDRKEAVVKRTNSYAEDDLKDVIIAVNACQAFIQRARGGPATEAE